MFEPFFGLCLKLIFQCNEWILRYTFLVTQHIMNVRSGIVFGLLMLKQQYFFYLAIGLRGRISRCYR